MQNTVSPFNLTTYPFLNCANVLEEKIKKTAKRTKLIFIDFFCNLLNQKQVICFFLKLME